MSLKRKGHLESLFYTFEIAFKFVSRLFICYDVQGVKVS